jgi:outer membrane protein assembly factor BamE (lipoprotein component of BamABCDE complex)
MQQLSGQSFFTCCNLHYDNQDISDANYWVGKLLPAGTLVRVGEVTESAVALSAGDLKLKLTHEYGTDEEPLDQYLGKVLVKNDPKPRIATYQKAVRRAIMYGKVEIGMTREQVLLSLGYPTTDRTPSLQDREWTYWYNQRGDRYKVAFDEAGKVSGVIGRPAPTAEVKILNADAPQDPNKDSKKSKKHKLN